MIYVTENVREVLQEMYFQAWQCPGQLRAGKPKLSQNWLNAFPNLQTKIGSMLFPIFNPKLVQCFSQFSSQNWSNPFPNLPRLIVWGRHVLSQIPLLLLDEQRGFLPFTIPVEVMPWTLLLKSGHLLIGFHGVRLVLIWCFVIPWSWSFWSWLVACHSATPALSQAQSSYVTWKTDWERGRESRSSCHLCLWFTQFHSNDVILIWYKPCDKL